MRKVALLVGPRASGKSHFCEQLLALDPTIVLVSRDKILIKLFGKTSLSPYGGGHEYARHQVWEEVRGILNQRTDARLILDTWNGDRDERTWIRFKLRDFGADCITAWYFETPVEQVEKWFWQKPGIAKISEMRERNGQGIAFYLEDAPRRDYEMFHRLAATIDQEGFDGIVKINPLTTKPEEFLGTPTGLT